MAARPQYLLLALAALERRAEAGGLLPATLYRRGADETTMGSPIVRALLAGDRYHMPDDGPVERHMATGATILREARS